MWAAVLSAAPGASAIPAFARRYRTACTTCHSLPPQLNPYGQAFRANGYRLPAGESAQQAQDVALGAPEWDPLFPRGFLSGTAPGVPQLAGKIRLILLSELKAGRRQESAEAEGVLLTAGNLGERASYFASVYADNDGARLNRAFASIDHLAGPWLGIRAGQMEPAVVPFSRSSQRLSSQGYVGFERPLGAARLALGQPLPTLEGFGAGSDPGPLRGLSYAAGLAARDSDAGVAPDLYARLAYKFGGVAAAGDRSGQPGRLSPAIAPLLERSLRLGGFVYRASAWGPATRPGALRAGMDADFAFETLHAFAAGWLGTEDPGGAGGTSSWALLAGAGARIYPWLLLEGRYDGGFAGADGERAAVGTLRAALQQNVALTADLKLEIPHGTVSTTGALFLAF